jgi:hypothetical protein
MNASNEIIVLISYQYSRDASPENPLLRYTAVILAEKMTIW